MTCLYCHHGYHNGTCQALVGDGARFPKVNCACDNVQASREARAAAEAAAVDRVSHVLLILEGSNRTSEQKARAAISAYRRP